MRWSLGRKHQPATLTYALHRRPIPACQVYVNMNSCNEISYPFKYHYVHFRPHLDLRLSPHPSSIIHHPSSHTPHESRMSFNDPTESNSTGSHPNTCSLKCKFHPHGLEELKAEKSTIQKWLDFYPQKVDSWIPANSYWKASMLFRSYVSFLGRGCFFFGNLTLCSCCLCCYSLLVILWLCSETISHVPCLVVERCRSTHIKIKTWMFPCGIIRSVNDFWNNMVTLCTPSQHTT